MKRSTTILTLAGVLALTGCTTKVMDDRYYQDKAAGAGPVRNDPVEVKQLPAEELPARKVSAVPAKKGYAPMERIQDEKIGIDENAVPRRSVRRGAKASGTAAAGGVYIVRPGDTLGKIARRNHVSLKKLMAANNMADKDARRLQVGKKLVIPGGKAAAPVKAEKAIRSSKKGGKTLNTAAAPASAAGLNADGTYTVRKGDNIPKIARKFGLRARALQEANNMSDEATRKLQIGQKLVIPAKGKVTSAAKTEKKAAVKPAETAPASGTPVPPPAADEGTAPAAATPAAADKNTPAADSGAVAPAQEIQSEFVIVGECKTLGEFAAKHGTTVEMVRKLNQSTLGADDKLQEGQYLFVPRK